MPGLAQMVVELREPASYWIFAAGFVSGVLFCAWIDRRIRG
jgi:hypothetical protein